MSHKLLRRLFAVLLATTVANGSLAHAMKFASVGARSPAVVQEIAHGDDRAAACFRGRFGTYCPLCALSCFGEIATIAADAALPEAVTATLVTAAIVDHPHARPTASPPIRAPPLSFLEH